MSEKIGATFVATVYDVRIKRDGGGRIALDFGLDGLEDVQLAQTIAAKKNCAFQIAMVPIQHQNHYSDDEFVPNETGEIDL